jgi:hypothetical protein
MLDSLKTRALFCVQYFYQGESMKRSLVIPFTLILSIQAAKFVDESTLQSTLLDQSCIKKSDLSKTLRKLWNDHVIWTREYIIAATTNSPSLPFAEKRLMHNQVEIGNAVAEFYGKDAGDQLTQLLKEHIAQAGELTKAAVAGVGLKGAAKRKNDKLFKSIDKKWHTNADKISAFLHKANPYLPYNDVQALMYKHLELTTQEVVNRLTKNWAKDVETYDDLREEINHMADALTKGLFRAFPDKFKGYEAKKPPQRKFEPKKSNKVTARTTTSVYSGA